MTGEAVDHSKERSAISNRLSVWRTTALWILLGIVCGVATTLLATLIWHDSCSSERVICPSREEAETTDCGGSPAEARARGCRFDIMSFSWLPISCYDNELSSEFSQLEAWTWYSGPGGTGIVIPEDIVRLGEHNHLYVSADYHFFHCSFMWRKLHRVALGLRYMDSYIYNYNHTKHCEAMLRNMSPSEINTKIGIKYPRCWPAYANH
jgi:hypothetical protein